MNQVRLIKIPTGVNQGGRSIVDLLKALADYHALIEILAAKFSLGDESSLNDVVSQRGRAKRSALEYVKGIEKLCEGFEDLYDFKSHEVECYDKFPQVDVNTLHCEIYEAPDGSTRMATANYETMVMYINLYIGLFQEVIDDIVVDEDIIGILNDWIEVFECITLEYIIGGKF